MYSIKIYLFFILFLNVFYLNSSQGVPNISYIKLLDQSYPNQINECIISIEVLVTYPENSFASYFTINKTDSSQIKYKSSTLEKLDPTSTTIVFGLLVPITNPSFDILVQGTNITQKIFTDQLNGIFKCEYFPNNIKINNNLILPSIQYSFKERINNSTLLNIENIKFWAPSLQLNTIENPPLDIEMVQLYNGIFRFTYSDLKSPLSLYDTSKSIFQYQIIVNISNTINLNIDISNILKPNSVPLTTIVKNLYIFSSPENQFLIDKQNNGGVVGSITQHLSLTTINSFVWCVLANTTDSNNQYQLINYFKPIYGGPYQNGSSSSATTNSIFLSRTQLYESKKYGYLLYGQSLNNYGFTSNSSYTNLNKIYDNSAITLTIGSYSTGSLNYNYSSLLYDDTLQEFTLFNQAYGFTGIPNQYFQFISTKSSKSNLFTTTFIKTIDAYYKFDYLSDFPIGFSNGNFIGFDYNILFFSSKYSGNIGSISNYLNGKINNADFIPNKSIQYDYSLGQSYVLEFTKIPILNSMKMIIRLNISSALAIGIIKIGDNQYSAPSCLIGGNLSNGTFEVFYDYTFNPNPDIYIINNAYNTYKLSNIYGKYSASPIPSNPISVTYTILDLVYFKFSKNSIDLSNSNANISLFLNFKVYTPNYTPILYLNLNDNIYDNQALIGYYDQSSKLYRIDFTLPARLYSGNISYRLNITSIYNTEEIASIIGNSAYLSVSSSFADQMPPVIKNTIQINNSTHFGWKISIEEILNGFQSGFIQVRGDFDYIGYNFNFTLNDLTQSSSNEFIFYYQILIKKEFFGVNSNLCRQQNYTITEIYLQDNSGFYSYTDSSQTSYSINPLIYLPDHTLLSNKMNCIDPLDNLPPSLSGEPSIVLSGFNPFSNNRTLLFKYSVKDTLGISNRHYPIIQLLNVYNEKLYCKNIILNEERSNLTLKQFSCEITTPFSYGYPMGIHVSLYGIMDIYYNFYSTLNFGFINTTNLSPDSISSPPPFIVSNDQFSKGQSNLIVYGNNFGTNLTTIKLNLYNTSIILNNNIKIVFLSSRVLSIQNIPNEISFLKSFIIQLNIDNQLSNNYTIIPIQAIFNENIDNSSDNSDSNNSNKCTIGSNNKECSGNGKCINNKCECNEDWIGQDCSSKTIFVTPPIINTTNPDSVIDYSGDQVLQESIISIIGLREINITGSIVKNHTFDKWIYQNNTNSGRLSSLYTYYLFYNNVNTTIQVKVEWFNETTSYSFAGQSLTMLKSSIKYTISMNQYGFENQLNSLQLLMYTGIKSNSDINICTKDQDFSNENSIYNNADNNEYLKIQINDRTLIGRFIKRGIIDGFITSISNTYYPPTSNITKSTTSATIGINIPYFKSSLVLDPDWSVLVDSNIPNSCDDDGLTKTQLIGIIIGSAGAFCVLSLIFGFLIYKKLKYNPKILSLKDKFKKNNNNNINLKEL